MYNWTEQSVRWYADAVAYTGYDRKLADMVQPYLAAGETVCDLGCGTGYLALELARRGYAVTAVDRDSEVMRWLRAERERQGLRNLSVVQRDWDDLDAGPGWDTVIMVNAGGNSHETAFYQRFCRKRLIVVERTSLKSHIRGRGEPSVRRRRLSLRAQHEPTAEGDYFAAEFGQPFRSAEEARAYVEHHVGERRTAEEVQADLVATGDAEFPLYLPYRKEQRLLVFAGTAAAGAV